MSKEKQIEELTNELVFTSNYGTYNAIANYLVNEGYRKQSEGEWIKLRYGKADLVTHMKCSNCERVETLNYQYKYCPHCGASMKGGAE